MGYQWINCACFKTYEAWTAMMALCLATAVSTGVQNWSSTLKALLDDVLWYTTAPFLSTESMLIETCFMTGVRAASALHVRPACAAWRFTRNFTYVFDWSCWIRRWKSAKEIIYSNKSVDVLTDIDGVFVVVYSRSPWRQQQRKCLQDSLSDNTAM